MSGPKTPAMPVCVDDSRRGPGTSERFFLAALLLVLIPSRLVCAGDVDSRSEQSPDTSSPDSLAKWTVFQDEAFQDNSIAIHDSAAAMPVAQRFEFLANWVLPSDLHPTFRVTARFGSTNPSPASPVEVHNSDAGSDAVERLTPGVAVLSPAVELVEAARRSGRLDQLRDRIAATSVSPDDSLQRYCKATLQFLVEVAREDSAASALVFDEVIAAAATLDSNSVEARWPALLMLRAAVASADHRTRRLVTEFFFSIYQELMNYSTDPELDVLNDHLRTMFSLNVFLGNEGTVENRRESLSGQWQPFSYSDSGTRGAGRPPARWHSHAGGAEKISGHEMDYLAFRSPLRGNFQIECDFSAEHGSYYSFLVGGSTVQAVSGGKTLRIGNFRKPYDDIDLAVPLTSFGSTARFRAVVKDGVLTQFLNGQEVLRKELAAQYDPWVAMRSWRRSLGSVRDFRITGEPIVPDEIDLTGDPELSGWAPYFETGFGPGIGNWQPVADESGRTVILGKQRPEYAGAALQKLLRYCRPVIEDGTIEYDFYYRQGDVCVHPALDRLAFLLEPDGVKIHWITDRRNERFLLDPANVIDELENRRGPAQLPLQNEAWNRLRLDVTGDSVQLVLNGQAIYQRTLEESNQRTFGLFHYADRTEARVRNVLWRGDWPKQLPSVSQQDLASTELNFLDDRLPELTDSFHHDFRSGPLLERFKVETAADDGTFVEQTEHGLRTKLVSGAGFKELRSCLQVDGDFEIVVAFQDLEILMPEPRWSAGIGVRVLLDCATDDTLGFYRTLARNAGNRRTSFYHSYRDPDGKLKYPGDYSVEESTAGRFRIARRGTTFYALYAQDDSPNFRLIGKHETTTDPVAVRGLRLIAKAADAVSVTATWTEMAVRAEKISGQPLSEQEARERIALLNSRRDALQERRIDFVNPDPVDPEIRLVTAGAAVVNVVENGLRVTTVSNGRQEQFVIAHRKPFERGVDVEFPLSIHKFGLGDAMESPCEIALKVFYDSQQQNSRSPREATFILRKKNGGENHLVTRIVHRNSVNRLEYLELLSTSVKSPDSFRVAVHEGLLYFLYSESDSEEYRIATMVPVSDRLSATGFNLKFVTDGSGHSTDLTTKELIVYEAAAKDAASAIPAPESPAVPKSSPGL